MVFIYTVRISRIIANGTWETFDIIDKKSSVKIIQLIQKNNNMTIPELANELNISTRAIEKQIAII
jgi:predicted HTH transcriptional regulator